MEITQITSVIQNIVLSISGAATVIIAYKGLSTWRSELKGKSEYIQAKEILKAVYKVRNGFMHVRHPGIYSYEYPEEMLDLHGHLKSENDFEGTEHVYNNRWKFLAEAFNELEEKNLDAQVEWGSEFQNIIIPLRKCKAELLIAIQNLLKTKKNPGYRIEVDDSALYWSGEDSKLDSFTPKLNEAINSFEKLLRPYIKK